MDNEESEDAVIKEEVDPTDQEEMEVGSFTLKEEMVFVDVTIKEEDIEDLATDPFIHTLSGSDTLVHEALPGKVSSEEEAAVPGSVAIIGEMVFDNIPLKDEKILPDDAESESEKTTKQYGSRTYKPGPASRRKVGSRTADEEDCEPSTTSGKKLAVDVSKSSDRSGQSQKATSSKRVLDLDMEVDTDNADSHDEDDDDEIVNNEMEDAEDPENSSHPSLDDNAGEVYRRKTRTIPPYKDTNSTHSDERIFCHDCCREWQDDCPRHGPLVIVEDTPIPADINDALRAMKTVPHQLTVGKSNIPKAGCGVHTREAIPARIRFGPYQGKIVPPTLATSYAWLIRKNGKPDHCIDATEPGCSNWMRYVNCARTDEERNLEAFQFKGKLYYKTLRLVAEGEELMVSYGEAYERLLVQQGSDQLWEGLESSAETYSFPSGVLGSLGDASWPYLPSGNFESWDASTAQVTSTSTSSEETGPQKKGSNQSTWRRTISKAALDRGLEHVNAKGQQVKARKLGPNCGQVCRFKCTARFPEEMRLAVFNTFWGIGNHTGQWEFITRHCELYKPKQRKKDAIKPISASRKYFFRKGDEIIYVCKRMFCSTLDISEKWVHTALKRKLDNDTIAPDRRGKHPKIGKILKSVKDSVREHIKLIPKVDTLVGRTVKQYAEDTMSIRAMHRLYVEWMDQNAEDKPVRKASERQYRDIFLAEFKVGFYKRAKDDCSFCRLFEDGDAELKCQLQDRYDVHYANMEALRECRVKDRSEITPAKDADGPVSFTTCYASFDLLKVFVTPKSESAELHYKKRLSVYNFNVYDTANHEGFCFFWDEGIARVGEDEIASCLLYFIQIQHEENGMKEFRFYSGSSDFNKNKYLFSMYCYVASKYGLKVKHRYYEWGHTQNECDGIIGVIERASKCDDIFVPSQWNDVAKEAKKTGKPYRVFQLTQDNVFDFHRLAKNLQWRKDSLGEKIKWNQVKEVTVSNDQVAVRYSLAEEHFVEVPAQAGCPVEVSSWKLQKLYDEPLPIPSEKYDDLISLCDNMVVPEIYHAFYRSFGSASDLVEAPRRYYNDADPSEEGVLSDNFDDSEVE